MRLGQQNALQIFSPITRRQPLQMAGEAFQKSLIEAFAVFSMGTRLRFVSTLAYRSPAPDIGVMRDLHKPTRLSTSRTVSKYPA